MLGKLRLRQKNGVLIKKTSKVISKKSTNQGDGLLRQLVISIFTNG